MKLTRFLSLRGYDRSWLRSDVIAGLTYGPSWSRRLAYATIAGVSPVVGLYAAPGALILYAAFGSSRHLVTGPMSATAALSAGAIAELATQGSTDFASLTVALAIATGIIAVLAGLLRPGFLASFISEPVLKGFIVGLALTIIVGQLPQIFGVEKGSGDFFEKLWDLVSKLGDTSGTTLAVGLVSFGIVAGLRRIAPVVPGSLVAVAFGIAAVKLFDLSSHGVSIVGDSRAGSRPSGCPTSRRGATSTSRGAGSGSFSSGSRRAWAPPRRMRRRTTTTSTRTPSSWASEPPISAPGCRAAWS